MSHPTFLLWTTKGIDKLSLELLHLGNRHFRTNSKWKKSVSTQRHPHVKIVMAAFLHQNAIKSIYMGIALLAMVPQKNPSPQPVWSPKIRQHLVVTARSTARACHMSSYQRLLAASSRSSLFFFHSNLCRFRPKFAVSLPFEFVFALDHEFFSQKGQIRTRSEN